MRIRSMICALLCSGAVAFSVSANAATMSEVSGYLLKNLPADGDYSGIDDSGKTCSITVHRFLMTVVVDISGKFKNGDTAVLGGAGIAYMESDSDTLMKADHDSDSFGVLVKRSLGMINGTPQSV